MGQNSGFSGSRGQEEKVTTVILSPKKWAKMAKNQK
jgi:hypothetical protein